MICFCFSVFTNFPQFLKLENCLRLQRIPRTLWALSSWYLSYFSIFLQKVRVIFIKKEKRFVFFTQRIYGYVFYLTFYFHSEPHSIHIVLWNTYFNNKDLLCIMWNRWRGQNGYKFEFWAWNTPSVLSTRKLMDVKTYSHIFCSAPTAACMMGNAWGQTYLYAKSLRV